MNKQGKLFDIPFQMYTETQAYQESCDFLEEPALYTVAFVGAEQCGVLADTRDDLKQSTQIVWLPGDDAVRSMLAKLERREQVEFSIQNYVMQMCEYAADMGFDMCFLAEDEKELDSVTGRMRKAFPYLAIHGLSLEAMYSPEMLVNEINSIAPEILVLCVHAGEVKRYLENDRTKTNARLCICVEQLLSDEMSKKQKMFHTITMGRVLRRQLRKYRIKEQEKNGQKQE